MKVLGCKRDGMGAIGLGWKEELTEIKYKEIMWKTRCVPQCNGNSIVLRVPN